MLRSACSQLAVWHRTGTGPRHVTINVSALQLDDEGFADEVADALGRHGLEPRGLCIELTESSLMGRERGTRTLEAIAEQYADGRKPRLEGHKVEGQDVLALIKATELAIEKPAAAKAEAKKETK